MVRLLIKHMDLQAQDFNNQGSTKSGQRYGEVENGSPCALLVGILLRKHGQILLTYPWDHCGIQQLYYISYISLVVRTAAQSASWPLCYLLLHLFPLLAVCLSVAHTTGSHNGSPTQLFPPK